MCLKGFHLSQRAPLDGAEYPGGYGEGSPIPSDCLVRRAGGQAGPGSKEDCWWRPRHHMREFPLHTVGHSLEIIIRLRFSQDRLFGGSTL